MRRAEWILCAMVVASFVIGLFAYPYLPERMASHWNAQGEVNGYMPRVWGVFFLPIMFVIIAAIFLVIPRIDPKKENIARFRKYFDYLIIGLGIFFLYVYALTLFRNFGAQFNLSAAIIPPIAALFYLIGAILPHTEQNFMIGIRTPWTLSSKAVWRKTHEVGGTVFKACGVIMLLGMPFPWLMLWLILVPILGSALGLVIYSYVLYAREKH